MKLLDRYLLAQFGKNLLLVLCSLMAIYLLVDFFERIDDFLAAGKSIGLALQFFLLKIPLIFDQLIPVCILLAGIITLGVLNHNHEFMALKAGGICVTRIVAPFLAGTLFFTLLTLVMAQWVLPPTVARTSRIWHTEVMQEETKGVHRQGRIYFKGEQGIYSFKRPDPEENRFDDFSYTVRDAHYGLSLMLTARTAVWHAGKWSFDNARIKTRNNKGGYDIALFEQTGFDLPEAPADLLVQNLKAGEISLSQLYTAARRGSSRSEQAWIDFHQRLSYIFLGFPLLLLGIPVLLIVQQKWGRDLALAIPISCGLAFVVWGGWSISQSLADATFIPPSLASWSIHLTIGTLGLVLIRRLDN